MLTVNPAARWRARAYWAPVMMAVLLATLSFMTAAKALTLSAGQAFVLKDGTQVVFNLDAQTTPKVQILHNPQRLVIDIPNCQLGKLNAGLENSPDIRKLRVGKDGNTLRVVFDLSGEFHGRATIIKDSQYRLVADIFRNVPNTADKQPRLNAPPKSVQVASAPAPQPKPTTPVQPSANPETGWQSAASQPVAAATANVVEGQPLSTQPSAPAKAPPPSPPKQTIAPPAPAVSSPYRPHQVRVIIDPGHGGHDSGAVGPNGIKEKDVVLAISKKLAAMINADERMVAIMTRDDDTFRKLYNRVSFARQQKGDIFISIHANAVPKTSPKTQRGSMVFILNRRGATSKLAKYLAESENASGSMGGQDIIQVDKNVRDLVYGMVQGAVIDESRLLASHLLQQIKGTDRVFKYAVEGANFAVLSAPDVPSVLVETTFLSTPSEEKRLNQKDYQTKMAAAIYRGVAGFVQQRQHLMVQSAE